MILLLLIPALDGTIEDHLRALRGDDIEQRQTAVESLTILGEGGLNALREARPGADAETRARLAEIEARIEADVRRRAFPGGPEVLGLKAALAARWNPDRDEMVFTLEVMNIDGEPRTCVMPDSWDLRIPGWSWGTNRTRQRLEVRAVQVSDPGPGRGGRRMAFGGCGTARPPLVRLEPGDVRGAELRLGRGPYAPGRQLRPGLYEARAVYFAKKLLPGATADLETPWVAFTVPE